MTTQERALGWIEKEIRKTRLALGRAEYRSGVTESELENLRNKLNMLEWISSVVLAAK